MKDFCLNDLLTKSNHTKLHTYKGEERTFGTPCNPEKPSKYIMYLDANNLYGWAMSQCLPTVGFRWMTEKQIQEVNLAVCIGDRKKVMILEVDLEYPKELHEQHNDYPLATGKMKVTKEVFSPYCKNIQEQFGISIGQVAKLIPTLSTKKNYVLHYINLQLYLSLGLKLKRVHRVLEFDQSPWLAQYINFNTQKRMNAVLTVRSSMRIS